MNSIIQSVPPPGPGKNSEVLRGIENAVGRGVYFMANVKKRMDICFDHRAPSIVVEVAEYRNGYLDIRKRRGKIRALTEITKDNSQYCKKLMNLVDELRHLDGVNGGLAVSEKEYMATTNLQESKPLTQVIYSNVTEFVEQQQYFFDILWQKAIPAIEKIKEIEEGIVPDVVEAIRDPSEIQKRSLGLIRSAKGEILMIFSTANALLRQRRAGTLKLLNELAEKGVRKRGIPIRLLIQVDVSIRESVQKSISPKIHTRFIEPGLQRVNIMLVDKKFSLAVEVKDDSKKGVDQAIGFATFSNSQSTVLSYISIFEALWNQTELYEQLKEHERLEKEFIDIAAHELRTPLQPIISYNALALKNQIDKDEAMTVIDRQARRLRKLATDLLNTSKIESGSLTYKMQKVRINELILDVINSNAITKATVNYHQSADIQGPSIKTELDKSNYNLEIDADRDRITEALTNIIDNAIKFTNDGTIKVKNHVYHDKNKIEIRISDTGCGIPKDILPRLYGKFVTKSVGGKTKANQHGTGLGLFITKAIISAHNGQIRAFNNDRGGATFVIVLPIEGKSKISEK
ncbi:MAG TPA: HAMP domain-containing sensor histidine kinase [Nitrososphaeraceae archaeon]